MEFREGFLFGRVIRRRICQWKPYNLIDADGTAVDLAATTHQPELLFRDPRNTQNDILYLESSTDSGWAWFYHGAIGIHPEYVNMYYRYPEGDIIPGKFANVDPIRPVAGDNISPVNGVVSPYEQPTDYVEVVIQPLVHLGAEFYNRDEDRIYQPILNLLFSLYWVQWFKSTTHPTLISDIALKRYEGARATFFKVGFGNLPHNLGPQLQSDWNVTPMSLDEASALGGR